MLEWIESKNHFKQIQGEHKKLLILLFYADFSSNAKRALKELENFSIENKKIPVFVINVEKIQEIHKLFGVVNVPTVLVSQNGKTVRRIEGVESAQFYARILSNASPSQYKSREKKEYHQVVVYTSSGCPACSVAKTHFRRLGINFSEIDISRDEHAAEGLVRRTGNRSVPQIFIDGQLVVGFDRTKIDKLLSIKKER
jgi:glutaredoxin-like YruB-family protein